MKKNIRDAKEFEFASMVFMYGNVEVKAVIEDDKVLICQLMGGDGNTDQSQENVYSKGTIRELLNEISEHDFIGEYDSDDNSIIVSDDESLFPVEWYFRAIDYEENELILVRGNDDSSEFNFLSRILKTYYPEFGVVDKLIKSATGIEDDED